MLAWQCPEASAIGQERLINQSYIQGGNADKPKKQQVPGPQWRWNHRNAEGSRWGQQKDKQVFSKEPFPCRPLQPLFQRLFLNNINEALPGARHCVHAFSDAHTLETGEGWVVMESRCPKSQALQGVHTTPSSWNVSSLSRGVGAESITGYQNNPGYIMRYNALSAKCLK